MKYLFLALILLLPVELYAESETKESLWEVSFGTTQMFLGWNNEGSFPVPTASTTLILSRTVFSDFALWGVVNLPLVPNKRITEDGVLEDTQTPPSLMLGVSYEIAKLKIDDKKSLGIDTGVSIGRSLAKVGQLFPVGAFRIKIFINEDTSIYAGATTSPYNAEGDLVVGFVYGVGTRF